MALSEARALDLSSKPLAADSTHFESHRVSRHYEKRRRLSAEKEVTRPGEAAEAPLKLDKAWFASRSSTSTKLPKATFAVATACHLILSVSVGTGVGSDALSFDDLIVDAWRQ